VRLPLLLTFVGMGLATYLTRAPLLVLLAPASRMPGRLPGWLEGYLAALPIALLTALAVPLVLRPAGGSGLGWGVELSGAVIVALVARRSGNLLFAVAAGVVLVAGLRALWAGLPG
jgi:branched-subunit amino acid transport protein